jgi:protease-4
MMNKFWYSSIVICALTLAGFILISVFQLAKISGSEIAVIPISGEITAESYSSIMGSASASADSIKQMIKKAEDDLQVKAVIFQINSGGGSSVGSEEIANAVSRMKKPKVAIIREIGASGAYWAASACDRIFASRLSIVGSIGVTGSYLEFSGLMEKYGVGYEQLTAGKYKDAGTQYRKLTQEEKNITLGQISLMQGYFINDISKRRNLSEEQKSDVSNAGIYTGEQALAFNLIDEIGGIEEAKIYLEAKLASPEMNLVFYSRSQGFFERIASSQASSAFYLGKGIGSSIYGDSSSEAAIPKI